VTASSSSPTTTDSSPTADAYPVATPSEDGRLDRIRLLENTASDLDQADRLLTAAYRPPSWRREVEVYLTTQADGWFCVDDGGEIVAMAGALAYGSYCWVGLVATLPDRQRQGFASRLSAHLLDWAKEHGCGTVALDANDNGRPVYERLGFRAVGPTVALLAPGSLPAPDGAGPRVEMADRVDDILALDRSVSGGDRTTLLRAIWEIESPALFVVREAAEPAGYLFVRDRLLGPGCARTPAIAEGLIRAALDGRSGEELRMLVPIECGMTTTLFDLGFREQRRLTHMRFGELQLPGQRTHLFAQASFAAG
jgi:GNAT superfamily N-acetyltransferase